jgi:hypothetical protein
MGPRVGLDTEDRGKSFVSAGDQTLIIQSVVRQYTEWATPVQKSKAVPISSCTRQRGKEFSFYSFLTSALYAGEWSASRPGRALSPEKDRQYPLDRRIGGAESYSGLIRPVSTHPRLITGRRTYGAERMALHIRDTCTPGWPTYVIPVPLT